MGGLRVAAVQLGLSKGSTKKAVEDAEAQVRVAAAKGANLICLPEHWLLSNVIKEDDPVIKEFTAIAHELGVHVNLGANFERRGTKVYITSQTISPDGGLSRQDKVHLYRREKRPAIPGFGFTMVDVKGFKIGVIICHDIVFPETAREATIKGAELLIVPSLITVKGIEPWLVYLRARALENRVPVVAPNLYAPPNLPGRTTVIDLKYDRKEHIMELLELAAPPRKTSLVVDIDIDSKRSLRKERFDEVRPMPR